MTSRELIRWALLHERRSRAGWWTSPWVIAIVAGAAMAGWVAWRQQVGFVAASHAWLAATLVTFAVAFMRVPFHLYWRSDAALLAQLPIEGGPLFDAALVRCVRAAAATTLATLVGAAPLARESPELFARAAAIAGALGACTALFMPAVATFAATLVAIAHADARAQRLRAAAGVAQAPPSSAMLGALPGFAGTFVIVGAILEARWLVGRTDAVLPPGPVLGGLAAVSVLAILAARASAHRRMGTILRDVSALDRQRLAHLEIRPPTALERLIGGFTGDGALAYSKDARLMRRRYPMAFALGALAFLVLVIIGIAQPDDPGPWLTATLAGTAVYAIVLSGRLRRPPIELARLSSTLPLTTAGQRRAKTAWLLGWWTIFILIPGSFAVLRQADLGPALALLGGATALTAIAALRR